MNKKVKIYKLITSIRCFNDNTVIVGGSTFYLDIHIFRKCVKKYYRSNSIFNCFRQPFFV